MSTYGPTGPNGYTCTACRMFVFFGSHHSCGTPTFTATQPDAVALALGRIEALLQQILRKLETQA